jgi:spermidine synthase
MSQPKARRWIAEQADGNEIYLFAVNRTIAKARTQFQDVEIVETASYGTMLLLDGIVQSSEDDEHAYHEALVHPGLIAHPAPREVLIIGGGEGATLREVLRHRTIERVTMVDLDGELVALCKEHLDDWHQGSFDDPRVELIISDGRAYLEATERTFDAVICDVTDFLDNGPAMRLYTREFYRLVAERLNPGGLLIVQALETSISDHEEHALLVRTVGEAFSIVRSYLAFIPSFVYSWGFLVASETVDPSTLTQAEVDARLAERLTSTLTSYDGIAHQGLFSLPKDLRALLAEPGPVLEDATIETWSLTAAEERESVAI